jgi:zinc protease
MRIGRIHRRRSASHPRAASLLDKLLIAALAMAAWPAVHASEIPDADRIVATTLANGMQVILWPDRDIPNIALYNWVRVGSRNEAPGRTGLAHFFEHMMFNGTSRRAPGEFDRILEANGARNNAFTTEDVTVYQDWFPSTALEVVLELEADRLQHLAFDPKVIESERGVVYSERRLRVEDNQFGRLQEQVQATAFLAHPYGFPIVGWPSDIESWSIDDLKHFFDTYYAPNNCTLVLVGDFDPKQALAFVRKHLEPLPANPPPPPVRTVEPQQQGERRVTIQAQTQTPILQFAYHGLAASDDRYETLDLLTRVLTDGDASRLHRALVEERQVAIEVQSYFQAGFDPGLTWFVMSLPAGADPAQAEAAFDQEIRRIATEGIDEKELERARNQALADFWRGLTTIDGKAQALGSYAVLGGDYKKLFNAPAAYRSVTAEQVRKLAAELLASTNRTVGVLAPAKKEGA